MKAVLISLKTKVYFSRLNAWIRGAFSRLNVLQRTIFLITSMAFILVTYSFGQAIKVDAEIRSRGEYRDGFQEPLVDTLNPAYVNNLRTKLNFTYYESDVNAKITLIDTRTLGSTEVNRTERKSVV